MALGPLRSEDAEPLRDVKRCDTSGDWAIEGGRVMVMVIDTTMLLGGSLV